MMVRRHHNRPAAEPREADMVAAAVRIAEAADADGVLKATAEGLMEILGIETAAVNRLVPADDEYEVTAVVAERADGQELLGSRYGQQLVEGEMLDPAYAVLPDIFLVPPEAETAFQAAGTGVPSLASLLPPIDAPDAWRDHALLLALRDRAGNLLAVLSLDDPSDGLLPSITSLQRGSLLLRHAGTALEARLAEAEARRGHEEAAALASIASSLNADLDERELLTRAVRGACEACGYEAAVLSVLSADGATMEIAAAYGARNVPLVGLREPVGVVLDLLQPRYLLSSSYLLTGPAALAARSRARGNAERVGRGRRGWMDHHLLVPIRLAGRPFLGVLQVDDPVDRMIPSPDRLHLLEAFAQQIALVLDALRRLARARDVATRDPLTGLPNRARIFEWIDCALTGDPGALAVLFVDLDGLKAVNDELGHDSGDRLLVAVAERLLMVARPGDGVGRLAGDEFVLVCPGISERPAASELVSDVLDAFSAPFAVDGLELAVSASIGVALARPGVTAETLVRDADLAMYRVKGPGRERRTNGGAH